MAECGGEGRKYGCLREERRSGSVFHQPHAGSVRQPGDVVTDPNTSTHPLSYPLRSYWNISSLMVQECSSFSQKKKKNGRTAFTQDVCVKIMCFDDEKLFIIERKPSEVFQRGELTCWSWADMINNKKKRPDSLLWQSTKTVSHTRRPAGNPDIRLQILLTEQSFPKAEPPADMKEPFPRNTHLFVWRNYSTLNGMALVFKDSFSFNLQPKLIEILWGSEALHPLRCF